MSQFQTGDHVAVYSGSIAATGTVTEDGGVALDAPVVYPAPEDLWARRSYRQAVAADAFLDTLGVNIHMSYLSTPYGKVDKVLDALTYLGVRHVRDGECSTCLRNGRQQHRQLAKAGCRFTLVAGDFTTQPGHMPETNIPAAVADLGEQLVAIEGINEPNRQSGYSLDKLAAYYKRVRALMPPGVPLVGPAFTTSSSFASFATRQPTLDHGNMHPYPGGADPSNSIVANMTAATKVVAGKSLPLVATETGYHNAVNSKGGHRPATEAAAGVYMPRVFLEYFRRGVQRTFIYELVDQHPDPALTSQERNFGLFRNDWSPKPAADAVRALTAAVGTGTPDKLEGLWYEVAAPVAVRDLLIQRGDGSYCLILWRPAPVWDQNKLVDVPVTAKPVTITLGQPVNTREGSAGQTMTVDVAADSVYLDVLPQEVQT